MQTDQLLLIDLSGIAHQIWHVSGNEPDPSHVSTQIIARVRALATEHPHAAICCDSGKSFRADIDPTYKANRDTENRAPLRHQMDVACETLKRDGFVIWRAAGFEADDIIATATAEAMKIDGATVLIVSSDKDLLQLVNDRVTAKSLTNGNLLDAEMVFGKFGVRPHQMLDYLCLVGDTSDNIKGAKGIGGVIAARLLAEHGTLQAIYNKMANGVVQGMTPSVRSSLVEFADRWPTVAKLIALRADVPIPFAEIAAERTAPAMETDADDGSFNDAPEPDTRVPFEKGNDANDAPLPFKVPEPKQVAPTSDPRPTQRIEPKTTDIAVQQPVAPPVPAEFSQQLEPRTMPEAITLAKHMFESRLFSAYGTPQAVLSVVMAGREFGMPAMASLRGHHIIDGQARPSADTIAGIVLASGKAKYFKPTQRSATVAAFKTLRKGDDEDPVELAYTIEEARLAWKKDQKAWDASGWGKSPADMLVARAKSKLARLVYPDVVGGLYSFEEME